VAIELTTPPGEKLATGRVVGIVRRAWRPLCGSLQVADGAFAR
jgi:hypothetical protein